MEADGSWVASALPTVAPLRLTIRRRCAFHVHQNNGLNLQHLFRGAHASRGVSRAVFGVSPNTVFGRDAPAPVPPSTRWWSTIHCPRRVGSRRVMKKTHLPLCRRRPPSRGGGFNRICRPWSAPVMRHRERHSAKSPKRVVWVHDNVHMRRSSSAAWPAEG